jgi:hypothetical protein
MTPHTFVFNPLAVGPTPACSTSCEFNPLAVGPTPACSTSCEFNPLAVGPTPACSILLRVQPYCSGTHTCMFNPLAVGGGCFGSGHGQDCHAVSEGVAEGLTAHARLEAQEHKVEPRGLEEA